MVAGSVLLAGAGGAASLLIKSPAQAAAQTAAPPMDVLTAPVERRVLRETVKPGQSVLVSPSVSGGEGSRTPVVTKLPAATGTTVHGGQVLLEVSGRPVFALEGKLPVYRDLKPGAVGDAVAQLQKALAALGHRTGSDQRGTFGEGTKAALTSFYASIGYDALPAQVDGGAAATAAEQAMTGAERALEDAEDAGDEGHAAKAGTAEPAQRAVDLAKEDLTRARQTLAQAKAADGPMLPAGEVVFLKSFPACVSTGTTAVGSPVSGPVMTLSAGALVVHGYLQEHQKGMVPPGQRVQILSELSGVTATGTVVSVADTMEAESARSDAGAGNGEAGPDQNAAGGQGYAMLVRPDKPLGSELINQDVRLTVEAASTDGKALAVPVTAISAQADGKSTVTVVQRGGARHRVEVFPKTTGDGFVEVLPVGSGKLAEGDEVVTGVDTEVRR
ncbi:peptidoglycan-binding protein [Streptomyces sp. NPDC005969]|uniref:peptidoglycan-binding protein n=1 Tax=Streptomyces sp. NPDC005969 TaxID=3156722 RepID=UPI0033D895E3